MKTEDMTNGRALLHHVWCNASRESWDIINNAMRTALYLAVGTGMELNAQDIADIYNKYRGGYWMGEDGTEWLYKNAVFHENMPVIKAIETRFNRKPFFANDIEFRMHGRSYRHHSDVTRKRDRIALGTYLHIDNRRWRVTGIEADAVRFVLETRDGEPQKRLKLTREQLAELFPAPKRQKKPTPTE